MKEQSNHFYEFDDFRVEVAERCLRRAEQIVALTPKAFDTLLLLLHNRGKVIEKDVFLNEVWPDTYVGEATLAQNISTVRKALGTSGGGESYIETIPRRGYRFIGDVREFAGEEETIVIERRHLARIVAEHTDTAEDETAITVSVRDTISSRPGVVAAVAALTLIAAAFGVASYLYFSRPSPMAETAFKQFSHSTIASSADVEMATISPDGRYIAMISNGRDKQTLAMKQTDGGNVIEVVSLSNSRIIGASFSRKGEQLYYSSYDLSDDTRPTLGSLYRVPMLGGASERILEDIDSPAAISPDGTGIAFIRHDPSRKESSLMLADAGGLERRLATRRLDEHFAESGPSWSPDGRFLAAAVHSRASQRRRMELVVIDPATGEQQLVASPDWYWVGNSAWLSDGSGIAVVAYGSSSPNLTDEIWFVSFPSGGARLLTNGINGIFGISLTEDGNSIVAAKLNQISTFYTASASEPARPTALAKNVAEESLLPLGADFAPDGRIVYSQTRNGNSDIWMIGGDGSEPKQMTSDPGADLMPRMSADGQSLIFVSNRSGSMNLWRMDPDGKNAVKITDADDVRSPTLSRDGNWIFYAARDTGDLRPGLWRVAAVGGSAVKLTSQPAWSPRISPDGKLLACLIPDTKNIPRLSLVSATNGDIVRQFDLPGEAAPLFEWKADGTGLYVILDQNSEPSLWLQPVVEGKAGKLRDFDQKIFRFAVSNDGKNLFWEAGEAANSVVLLKNLS